MIFAFNHAPNRPRGVTGNSAAVGFFGFFPGAGTPPVITTPWIAAYNSAPRGRNAAFVLGQLRQAAPGLKQLRFVQPLLGMFRKTPPKLGE